MDDIRRPVVLVVEDEEELASLYERWLSDTYTVVVVHSGEEALERIDGAVDAVLLDRRLPDMPGDAVLEEIRALGLDVGVAMITAVEPSFDILELGFDKYLVKPVSVEEINDVVLRLLERSTYSPEIQEYFSLLAKQTVLEARLDPVEIAESEEYRALETRIAEAQRSIRSEG